MKGVCAFLTSLLACFPEVSFGFSASGGIQPIYFFPVVIFTTISILRTNSIDILLGLLLSLFYLALSLLINQKINVGILKDSAMFFLLFFSFHFFLFLKRNFSDLGIAKFIQGVIVVWFLGAILQIVFGKELFSFLLSQRGTEDRGLTSFASEPSFFSLQIAFLLGILILMDPRDRKYLYLWIFILGNILPLSLAGSIYLLSFYFSALLAKKKSIPYGILVAACAVVAFAFYNFEKLQVFRYFQLLETLGSEPLEVFGDASALKRFHQITTPFLLSYENFFSPYLGPVTEFKPTNFVISQDDTVGSFIGNFILRTGALFLGLFLFICWHFRLKSNHLTPLVVLLPGLIMPISSVHPLAYFFLAALFSFLAQRDRHRGGEGI